MEKISRETYANLVNYVANSYSDKSKEYAEAVIISIMMTLDVEVEDKSKPEIIEGLSPGKWTYEYNDDYCRWDVKDGAGDVICSTDIESEARLIAGSKEFLEAVVKSRTPVPPDESRWKWRLKWLAEYRLKSPSSSRVLQVMQNMGVVFPGDDDAK